MSGSTGAKTKVDCCTNTSEKNIIVNVVLQGSLTYRGVTLQRHPSRQKSVKLHLYIYFIVYMYIKAL